MGLQLIFVIETDSKCKSDWIYIKDTIERFYRIDQAQIKLRPVYMGGKGKYMKKEKEISQLISQYSSTSSTNQSKVIFCFDCDDYDFKQADMDFLNTAKQYCITNKYAFVWFCKDIERVYIGKKVEDNEKQREAVNFKSKGLISTIDKNKLLVPDYRTNSSNLMIVLDNFLVRQ